MLAIREELQRITTQEVVRQMTALKPKVSTQSVPPPPKNEMEVSHRYGTKALLAYCVKCKKLTEMMNPQVVTMKNGKHAFKGTCAVCGTTVQSFRNI
jgi:hypothetical protein